MVRKSGRPSQRGGRRLGQQGKSYAQRTDLNQPVRTATGQPYGEAGRQAETQKVIPLPGEGHGMGVSGPVPTHPYPGRTYGRSIGPMPHPGGLSQTSPDGMGTNAIVPGGHGPLDAPTNRPGEPLTAGLPTGAGPGPEALGTTARGLTPLDQVRAIYAADPNEDMRRLLAYLDQ